MMRRWAGVYFVVGVRNGTVNHKLGGNHNLAALEAKFHESPLDSRLGAGRWWEWLPGLCAGF